MIGFLETRRQLNALRCRLGSLPGELKQAELATPLAGIASLP